MNGNASGSVASSGKDDHRRTDLFVVCASNAINISMAFLFGARLMGVFVVERSMGVLVLILGLALGYVACVNAGNKRDKWEVLLLLPILLFSIVHMLVDYIMAMDFRSTAIVGPYLLLYYFSLWMLIGYAFRFEKKWGFLTLATYFLNMAMSLYQYMILGR